MPSNDAQPPWLTIVTVVKDAPDDFARTVESVVVQDLEGVEYVVVDSSSDSSPILASLARVPEIDCPYTCVEPRGIYPAMNAALALASGEYVYFLNAGDLLHSSDVLRQVGMALRPGSPTWAFGEVEIVQANGSRLVTPRWDYAKEKAAHFSRGRFPPHQGTFVRRDALRAQGGFDPTFTIVADYASFLKLSTVADPLYLETVIATFVEGGVSTTRWQESLRQFHRARRQVLRPAGLGAVREYAETARQAVAMGLYRGVWSRVVQR